MQSTDVNGKASLLRFHYQLSERCSAFWDTTVWEDSLFLEMPTGPLAEGSKEGLTALLEFAEDKLKVNSVVLWFRKGREDRLSIIKTFNYIGFEMVKPGDPSVPARPDLVFMLYSLDIDSSSDEELRTKSLETMLLHARLFLLERERLFFILIFLMEELL